MNLNEWLLKNRGVISSYENGILDIHFNLEDEVYNNMDRQLEEELSDINNAWINNILDCSDVASVKNYGYIHSKHCFRFDIDTR